MIQLDENRSRTWFKVLGQDGCAIDGSAEHWSLPRHQEKGDVLDFSSQQARAPDGSCTGLEEITGTWLVSDPSTVYRYNSGMEVYIAEPLASPAHEQPGILWVPRVRLVREATGMDLKRFGIFRTFAQVF